MMTKVQRLPRVFESYIVPIQRESGNPLFIDEYRMEMLDNFGSDVKIHVFHESQNLI
jgi:hypothetical protein